jgi:nucleotide-binding universal stress UspA family protein
MFQNILIPLDGSERAEQSLSYGVELCRLSGGTLLLVRVVPSPAIPPARFSMVDAEVWPVRQAQLEQEAVDYLAGVNGRFDLTGTNPQQIIGRGPTRETLLRIIEEREADVVVITGRRRRGPARWILGSTADFLVQNSPVPILLLRDDGQKANDP